MIQKDLLGTVVLGKAGRDSDRFFVILDIIDNNYVMIADGSTRKLENPKRKKLKHLALTEVRFHEEVENLHNKSITNSKLRKLIKSLELDKEVWLLYGKRGCYWNGR